MFVCFGAHFALKLTMEFQAAGKNTIGYTRLLQRTDKHGRDSLRLVSGFFLFFYCSLLAWFRFKSVLLVFSVTLANIYLKCCAFHGVLLNSNPHNPMTVSLSNLRRTFYIC